MKKFRFELLALALAVLLPATLVAQDEEESGPRGAFSANLGAAYLVRGDGPASLAELGVVEDLRLAAGITLLGTDDPASPLFYGFDFRFLLSYGSTTFYSGGSAADEVLFVDWPIRAAVGYELGDLIFSGFAGPTMNLINVAYEATSGSGTDVALLLGVGLDAAVRAQFGWGPYLEIGYSIPNGLFEISGSPTLTNPAGLRLELGWYLYTYDFENIEM
jgi:hypothetical protein